MEKEILDAIKLQDEKLDEIYKSVEKSRKYILYISIATVAIFVLPLIGLLFAIPSFISSYSSLLGGF